MKKIQILLLAAFSGFALGFITTTNPEWFSASIFSQKVLSPGLGIEVVAIAPESPDFLNTFNAYRGGKSEKELMQKYAQYIQGSPRAVAKYGKEIVSYVDRVSKNEQLKNKLPMWPEYNLTTVGHLLAYLFANERNPLQFAIENKIVSADVKSGSYLSRREFIEILGKVFMNSDRDPYVVLMELGFIDEKNDWNSRDKNGFLLVEAIRVILDLRELIERKNITSSKESYQVQKAALPAGAAVLSAESIRALINAFAVESSVEGIDHFAMQEYFVGKYAKKLGKMLTAEHITAIRNEFYNESGLTPPAVYQLPTEQRVGDCTNEAFRKTYMGSVAVTGPAGASIICDEFLVNFPANAYLLNLYSLPKITVQNSEEFGGKVIRTDVMRTYENALVVDGTGEQKVFVGYSPKKIKQLVGKTMKIAVGDHTGNKLAEMENEVTDLGLLMEIHLRMVNGDNLILKK